MFSLRRSFVVAGYFAGVIATTGAHAGAKDESAAEWLAPKWFNDWHDGLTAKGLNFSATYIGDYIGNVSGGTGQGAVHLGRFEFSVDADLEKLIGWTGARFFANTYEIYGQGLTHTYIHNLATISETEALPDARLYMAYFEQNFYNNALNIRVGQQAADVEFFDSQTDDLFINGTFGWPAIKASNLPAGGPAPPIGALGIRIKAAVSEQITVFGAVFNGDASAPGAGDPQLRDNHGFVSGERRAMGHRAGPLGLRSRHRWPPARWQLHAGRLVPFRTIRRPALYRAGPIDRRSERNRHRGKT
jgi:porin